jgi:ribosomal protein S20
MKHIIAQNDFGEKATFDKWNGQFYTENDLNEIVHVTEDTAIFRPDSTLAGQGIPIAYVITNVFPNDEIRNTLYEVEESSVMRANCSGPIVPAEMAKKGLIEGEHYKLRTSNSYHTRTKSGGWGMIAYANEINSVMIGAKRGRFTGKINISNKKLWSKLQTLSQYHELAMDKADPELYERQSKFAKESIEEKFRHGMITTLSANRYSAMQSKAMSIHSDGKDVEYTTMCCFRQGEYTGAYLSFPRWGVGLDLPDNSVCIADSQSLHGVTPIYGAGQRFTTVAYTDRSCATIGNMGKSERLIGKFAKKESGNLEDFL